MAITTQIFTDGTTTEFANALASALDGTGLFDSVSVASKTVTCTKNSQAVLVVKANSAGSANPVIVVNNSAGSNLISAATGATNGMDSYASISVVGSAVFCVLSNAVTGSGVTTIMAFCVDSTDKNGIGFYVLERTYEGTNTHKTACIEAIEADTRGVTNPIATNRSNINTYQATAQNASGDVDVFSHTFGVRYSPALHTYESTQIGVTPAQIKVGAKTYVTDGFIMIEDV